MTMSQLVQEISKAEFKPTQNSLTFEICCNDEDDEDVEVERMPPRATPAPPCELSHTAWPCAGALRPVQIPRLVSGGEGGEGNCIRSASISHWAVGGGGALGASGPHKPQQARARPRAAMTQATSALPPLSRRTPRTHILCSSATFLCLLDYFDQLMLGQPRRPSLRIIIKRQREGERPRARAAKVGQSVHLTSLGSSDLYCQRGKAMYTALRIRL